MGQQVQAGQRLGLSGNSGNARNNGSSGGNATGPHLHFGLRMAPFNRHDGWGGYSDPAPYLQESGTAGNTPAEVWPLVREATREFGVNANVLVSFEE